MYEVLSDPALYRFTGGAPPETVGEVERWFTALESRQSPDGSERWLTWIVQLNDSNEAIGYVQATVAGGEASVAWLIGSPWQGRGFAREAVRLLGAWLQENGIRHVSARIHPDHRYSQRVAARLGMEATGAVIDGEDIWSGLILDGDFTWGTSE
ncbi:GNAT family N-acetyltransferase [Seongchinamella sediminis]|uniref:GNAT family N-acetyltransferase n=2 Tax=Seongchinamella sediminis TaxID=2283635 RepID=A0A3L7E2Y8_9GAMM|nr:GNAT family N-acetyltransferase [Seongchinamella sediminis]